MSTFKPTQSSSSSTNSAVNLGGSTLVLPLVSLGNCPQLAGDLLIETYRLELKGSLTPAHHVPVAGQRERDPGFFTPVEVYQSQSGGLTLLHQRSPPLKSEKDAFIQELLAFIKQAHFKSVLILSSMDASTRRDRDLAEGILTPLRYVSLAGQDSALSTGLQEMCPQHQKASPVMSSSSPDAAAAATTTPSIPHIPAGGITRRLLEALQLESELLEQCQVAALLMYLVEGDNRSDARTMASALSHLLHLQQASEFQAPEAWQEPPSWTAALYGRETELSMF